MPEIDFDGAKDVITKPIGPLPLYGWVVIGVGAFFVAKMFRAGGNGSSAAQPLGNVGENGMTTSTLQDMADEVSSITDTLGDIQDQLSNLPVTGQLPPPSPGPTPTPTPTPEPTPTPSPGYADYVVKTNDTWNKIAQRFNMTLPQFYEANPKLRDIGHPNAKRGGGRTVKVATP